MSATLAINLAGPIRSAAISNTRSPALGSEAAVYRDNDTGSESDAIESPEQRLDAQEAAFRQVNQMLKNTAAKLNKFFDRAFAAHKDDIAKLSVEIARKILAQRVKDGDYDIESVIREAISNAPERHDLVVHLNPEDLSQYDKLRQAEPGADLAGVKFVPDANIGRAECLLETPKGIIESLIDQHLEQVGNALMKVK